MTLRLCSYNVEWSTELFTDNNQVNLEGDTEKRGKHNRPRKEIVDALKLVLGKIDADVFGVVEAPDSSKSSPRDTVKSLEALAAHLGIRASKALMGFSSGGQQELALLYDPGLVSIEHAPGGKENSTQNPPFDGELRFDTDEDRIREVYTFHRPPLEARITRRSGGSEFYLMLAHPKSKGIFSSVDLVHWERENERNRRKLLAECSWIRKRVDEWLDQEREVIVMGDMNDGPGMDHYEMRMRRSALELIMGNLYEPDRVLLNRIGMPHWGRYGWEPSTTRFWDRFTGSPVNALIDHILASRGLEVATVKPHRIWNPFLESKDPGFEPTANGIKSELLCASDHFPVTLDLA